MKVAILAIKNGKYKLILMPKLIQKLHDEFREGEAYVISDQEMKIVENNKKDE